MWGSPGHTEAVNEPAKRPFACSKEKTCPSDGRVQSPGREACSLAHTLQERIRRPSSESRDKPHWEIGNEQWSPSSETDFHANPHTRASYAEYEPVFYSAMKTVNPSILIDVPVASFRIADANAAGRASNIALKFQRPRNPHLRTGAKLVVDNRHARIYRCSELSMQLEAIPFQEMTDGRRRKTTEGARSGRRDARGGKPC
jgi:hypothetical protein